MNFGLLWLEVLLIALLWVAALAAYIGRVGRKWVRAILMGLVVVIPLAFLGRLAFATGMMKFSGPRAFRLDRNWFNYTLSLLVASFIGMMVIVYRARQRRGQSAPAAAAWRRGWLAFSWLLVVMMGYLTLGSMDLAVRTRCALLYQKVNALYLATMPPVVSQEQNAAPIYEKAFATLKQDPGREINNPPLGENETFDPDEPATVVYLKRHEETIALLRQAAAMPICRFDQDLTAPDLDAIYDGLKEARQGAELLNLHAREAAAKGQTAEAVADAQAIFGISRHFRGRPTIVCAVLGMGIQTLGDKTLEVALPAVQHPEELVGLHLPPPASIGRELRNALLGEERWGLSLYARMPNNLQEVMGSKPAPAVPIARAGALGEAVYRVFFLDDERYVTMMHAAGELATQPYYQIRKQVPQVTAHIGQGGLLTRMLAPAIDRILDTSARVQALDGCAHIAVAMTRYRLDHGTLPSELINLLPKYLDALPTDPFDGQPLRLAMKDKQWILYSVGPDGMDDGGADLFAPHAKRKGDLIFTLKPQHED